MYSKETIKNTNSMFFTSFGKYMGNNRSYDGSKVKWINYSTGIKQLYIRIQADQYSAKVCIDIQHKDSEIRELFYEQFLELKNVFHSITQKEWIWNLEYLSPSGNILSRIHTELSEVSIYDKGDWKKIFKFYKFSLLKFDEFWVEFKDLFMEMQ